MLPPLLQNVTTTPAGEAAFRQHAAELTAQLAPLAVVIMIVCTLVWWPLDAWVMPSPTHQAAFSDLRVAMLVVLGVGLLVLLGRPRAPRLVGCGIYLALLIAVGSHLGPLGVEGLTWLANASLGIVPSALIPLALRIRLGFTALLGLGLVGSFLLAAPPTPGALGQLSFAAFAVLFTVLAGELLLRVLRRAFFQQRDLATTRADLADLNASLTQRVTEQTQALRRLARHLDQALEGERRRIARDLHDDLGQLLTAIRYTHARLDARLPGRSDEVDELLADLGGLIDGTRTSVRGFLTELRPRVLDDYGLAAAAEWLVERTRATGLDCTLTIDPDFPGARYLEAQESPGESVDPEVALALFRVLQEATTNALKHAQARHLHLALRRRGPALEVEVRDDGVGFTPGTADEGLGLLGLQERLRAAGGHLGLTSTPGAGTRVVAALLSEAP